MKSLLVIVAALPLLAQSPNVPIENEFVKVIKGTDAPNRPPGPVHEHKVNRVMIYMDDGDIQIKYTDGRVDNQHWKRGDIAWSPAGGQHTSQCVSANAVHIVEIELKNAGGGKAMAPKGAKAILDNAQVVVYRGTKAPAGGHYIAVDEKDETVLWDKMPEGAGPFVITELK